MKTKTTTLDTINIGLIILSCLLAIVVPFELFLLAYGILGPLHYLTEISWLHDKNYYAINKNNVILLFLIAIVITLISIKDKIGLGALEISNIYINRAIFIAFASSIFIATIKNAPLRTLGIVFIIIFSSVSDHLFLLFSIFIPTIIHVFVFTLLFMLYGALKSKSTIGHLSVIILAIVPVLLYFTTSNIESFLVSDYGIKAYRNFESLNILLIQILGSEKATQQSYLDLVYHSKTGISIMRVIAFSYTYHYLNWFSKTNIIQWHKISRNRIIVIALLWAISVTLYWIDYSLGFEWLFLLSFLHVLLEFPLNIISIAGIYHELKQRIWLKKQVNKI